MLQLTIKKEIIIVKISKFFDKKDRFAPLSLTLSKYRIKESNTNYLTHCVEQMKAEKKQFKRLIDEFESLDDVTFLEHFKKFYSWEDYKILAKYSYSFDNIVLVDVKTNDFTSMIVQEGSGRDFSYWTAWYKALYTIVCDASLKFENRVYTIKELSKLSQENKIIVLGVSPYGTEVDSNMAYKTHLELSKTPLNSNKLPNDFFSWYSINKDNINDLYKKYPRAFKIIREDVTKEELEKDYDSLCTEIKQKLVYIKKALQELEKEKQKRANELEKLN